MGRLTNALIFLVILQGCLILLDNSTPSGGTLWEYISNPGNWNSTAFLIGISLTSAGLTAATLTIGNWLGIKTDFMILACMVSGFIAMGITILTNLSMVIGRETAVIFCNKDVLLTNNQISWTSCGAAWWIVIMITGPLALYYAMTVIDFWRARD